MPMTYGKFGPIWCTQILPVEFQWM